MTTYRAHQFTKFGDIRVRTRVGISWKHFRRKGFGFSVRVTKPLLQETISNFSYYSYLVIYTTCPKVSYNKANISVWFGTFQLE